MAGVTTEHGAAPEHTDVAPEPVALTPCSPLTAAIVINTGGQVGTLEALGTDRECWEWQGETREGEASAEL